jgi:hypothetical protein
MKHLKKFEGFNYFEAFGMQRDKCDRCGQSTEGTTTMSVFNEDVICVKCKEEERNDPEYQAAVEAEREEIRKGNYNYKGSMPNYKPLNKFN